MTGVKGQTIVSVESAHGTAKTIVWPFEKMEESAWR
jgi:hypothetical protein